MACSRGIRERESFIWGTRSPTIIRYQTTINRQLFQAMNQLKRLRRLAGTMLRCQNFSLSETLCSIFDSLEICEAATRQLYLTRGILLSLLQLSLGRGFVEITSKR